MKRLVSLLIALLTALSLASCSFSFGDVTDVPDTIPNNPPSGPETVEPEEKIYKYNDFTPSEKNILTSYLGELIPFAPNDYYFLNGYNTPTGYDEGFNFCTIGNTAEEFEEYRALYSSYTLRSTYEDDDGDTWYCYVKGNLVFDISYYTYDGSDCIDVYAKVVTEDGDNTDTPGGDNTDTPGGDNTDTPGGDNTDTPGGGNTSTKHTYTDWTSSEKAIFTQYIGLVIPFIPNDDYTLQGYNTATDFENGIWFATVGNTEAEYNEYRALYSSYVFDGTYVDEEFGDVWYTYKKGDVLVDMVYYVDAGESYIEIYVSIDDSTDNGNEGTGGGNVDTSDVDLITNDGKGLPTGQGGVYNADFTTATNVKDVHDQGYYLDGCPTVGSPAVLVIPIGFSDGAALTGTHIDKLELAFGENGSYYYSVDNYYKISSYGKLDLDVTVLDEWFVPKYASTYYADLVDSEGYFNGDQVLMDEILKKLSSTMDLSAFDSDNNAIIDAVVLINNLEVGEDDFHWAYRYWNMYVDSEGYYYEYDGVSANDYLWASYYFLQESEIGGDISYTDTSVMNTYTYIHEFGHVLGADDYYDTSDAGNHPMDGHDVMDYMLGDHNPYTKFNLGWITSSRVVTGNTVTLTLEDFSIDGDTVIIANNWDPTLGAYQEYYVVMYYTNNGLNAGENGYFDSNGIVVYHVNSSLYRENYEGEIYYDVYNTNTDPSDENGYGTENNLVEFVLTADGEYTFGVGDTLGVTKDDGGSVLGYTFTVDSLSADTATVTFTKR